MKSPREIEALKLCKVIMKEHKLRGWKVQLNGRITRATARVKYNIRVIELGKQHLANPSTTDSVLRNTILHEVAHALLPPGVGHGPKWRDLFKKMGGSGRRLSSNKQSRRCHKCSKVTKTCKSLRVCPKCKASY